MTKQQFLGLFILSAIWGGSFILMRVLAPIFGPIFTSSFRLLSASLFLYGYLRLKQQRIDWKRHWKWFLIIGLLNSAVPFTLYSIAALHIPANLSVTLNSTSPMFGMIYGVLLIKERITWNKVVGLILGTIGVGIISSFTGGIDSTTFYLSVLACVSAASLYGLSGALIKRFAHEIPPFHLVLGSMVFGGIILLPFGFLSPISGTITVIAILYMIVFGVLGTAIAYLIYFTLIAEVGPVKALMTTYLMPVFGVFWSVLLLQETISSTTLIGLAVILISIYLITYRKKLQLVDTSV